MITNPIIPIWLMSIISFIIITLIFIKQKGINTKNKNYIISILIKTLIVILLFIINLRIMIPNGESIAINSDVDVLFVIDTSVSMRALDYNGNQERLEGVKNDTCYIVDELNGCRFSIITFGDEARKLVPFTNDSDLIQAELKSINVEDDYYAKGTSINLVKDELKETLKNKKEGTKTVVFFITDGEITKENEKIESFSEIGKYISNGAVLGYGTTKGGKMIDQLWQDEKQENGQPYYLSYYDKNYDKQDAISKIDENNLKSLAKDLKIDYINMSKIENIKYKIRDIKQLINSSKTNEQKISTYRDTYFYAAIPLTILFTLLFIYQKRRI